MKVGVRVEEREREKKVMKQIVIVKIPRWVKIVFFLCTMTASASFLVFKTPILLAVADAFLSAALSPASLSLRTIAAELRRYQFCCSLVDIPIVSFARSAIILGVYSLGGEGRRMWRGPLYLGVATACSAASLVVVAAKAAYMFGGGGYARAKAALLVSSAGLAVGHVAVAYRASCRERRKLLVHKIDIEAVSAYHRILQEQRSKLVT
ncbi:uncharacterized protein LOC127256436 isoform X2 [Andrographis paniculata]|uniref:uncharacterized protein LOC127256436 isoform X2 n=1 Tax=Andrographis paniculata TaxID=175694 RepID=UPI0021E8E279|nr:uncharacterized protein LOC127256436 isoform X2 [Andrographis paniculata]